jgi:hypothetical protein
MFFRGGGERTNVPKSVVQADKRVETSIKGIVVKVIRFLKSLFKETLIS